MRWQPGVLALRLATEADRPALERLAGRDSARPLDAPALVAEVDGVALAAVSLTDGRTIADPFHRTAELVELLRRRARQLEGPSPAPGAGLPGTLRARRAPGRRPRRPPSDGPHQPRWSPG